MVMHYLCGDEFGGGFVESVVREAVLFKTGRVGVPQYPGKVVGLLFFNKSFRTRFSFISAVAKLGVSVVSEDVGKMYGLEYDEGVVMNGDRPEHVRDMMAVLSRYVDVIGIRNSSLSRGDNVGVVDDIAGDVLMKKFASYATKPVVNMESEAAHPMQGLADVMAMYERFGDLRGKKVCVTWVPHVKKLPVATPQSQLLMPALMGADVVLTHPMGFELTDDCLAKVKAHAGSFSVSCDQEEGLRGADVVVAKSWASLSGVSDGEFSTMHSDWMLSGEKMKVTNNGCFSHCMPIRRNVEVTDEVIDSDRSMMLDVAENRLWVQVAVLNRLLSGKLV